MELDKLFIEIRNNLYQPFIFYIPKSLIPKDKKLLWENEKYAIYFNNVILIDKKGFDYELKEKPSYKEMMVKVSVLNENIFKLIEINRSLNEGQFSFFLEKYVEHVNFTVFVSDWMKKNVETQIRDLKEETKNSFLLQAEVFLKHLEDLKSALIVPKQKVIVKNEIDVLDFIENELVEIKNALNLNKGLSVNRNHPENNNKTIVKGPKKKLPLITVDEAEMFLLETVFNIKYPK